MRKHDQASHNALRNLIDPVSKLAAASVALARHTVKAMQNAQQRAGPVPMSNTGAAATASSHDSPITVQQPDTSTGDNRVVSDSLIATSTAFMPTTISTPTASVTTSTSNNSSTTTKAPNFVHDFDSLFEEVCNLAVLLLNRHSTVNLRQIMDPVGGTRQQDRHLLMVLHALQQFKPLLLPGKSYACCYPRPGPRMANR